MRRLQAFVASLSNSEQITGYIPNYGTGHYLKLRNSASSGDGISNYWTVPQIMRQYLKLRDNI